jgi:hypothetical protein
MKLILVLKFLILLLSCNNDKPKLKYNKDLDKSKEYYVVLMAGQSNMVGLGEVKDLDNCYLPNNVSYFNYSTNSHLKEFSNYYFGPEVGLAKRLNKEFPNLNFIFVKFAIGSSSINEWLPNVESKIYRKVDFGDLYDKFYKMTDSVTKNFNTKTLALLWMQGETDARYKSTSDDYENNFKLFISKVRKDYNNHNLPIVFGKVNPYSENHKYVSQIQLAQKNIINSLPNTYMIETETLDKQKDNVHYSSSGLLKLGEAYGDVLCLILKNEIEKL